MKEKTIEPTITEIKPEKPLKVEKPLSGEELKEMKIKGLKLYKESSFFKEKLIIGISGHRFHRKMEIVARNFATQYLKPNKGKISYIISGGATGWDLLVVKECIKLDIPFKLFLAFEEDKKRIPSLYLERAIEVKWKKKKYTSPKDKRHYQLRNINIVNEADELHVYLRKPSGGTVNTIEYCKDKKPNKPIFNWHNLSFINLPTLSELTLLGYRDYHFGNLVKRLEMIQMQRKLFKG